MFSETAVNMSLTDLSAAQAVEMLCARDITAVQYASALLAKAQEWECINAWAEIDPAKVKTVLECPCVLTAYRVMLRTSQHL